MVQLFEDLVCVNAYGHFNFFELSRVLPTVGGAGWWCPALSSAARHSHQSGLFRLALEKYQICDKKTSRDFFFTLVILLTINR